MIRALATGEPVGDVNAALRAESRASQRAWVMINMVTSIDGATAVAGGSTAMSDQDDRAVFNALRTMSDVILVGSGTVSAENYRPDARLAIVSGRLSLAPGMRVFSDPDRRPTVIGSTDADPDRANRLEAVADVILLDDMSGSSLVEQFPTSSIVLCEGGPTLNSTLFEADVVDEVNWTVAPFVVGGESKRMTAGQSLSPPGKYRIDRTWLGDESLFLRYLRA